MKNNKELTLSFNKWKRTINRFDNKSILLDLLYENADLFVEEILKGSRFFRGRVFDIEDIVSSNKQYVDWKHNVLSEFQGYSKNESGAPPPRSAIENRLNGKGIAFLYTCRDIDTVIYELRPTINEKISVAEFIVKKDLVFADLTAIKANQIERDIGNRLLSDLLRKIAEEFSIPHNVGHNYYFTQYLAGHFANMGFNGIVFKSSLNPLGENYVFFNPKDCEAIRSKLFMVNKIAVTYEPITRQDIKYFDE